MLESVSASFNETLVTLLSQWVLAFFVGLMVFVVLVVALKSFPAAVRETRLFWVAEACVLPFAILYVSVVVGAVFGLQPPDVWFSRLQEVKGVVLTLVIAYLVNRALTLFVWEGILHGYAATVPGIVRNLASFFIYLTGFYGILAFVFEQPVTGLLVSSGIAFGILGLAFQSTLTDIISGIAIAIERPFGVGDWIETDDDVCGKVVSIDWRATMLRTLSDTTHVIPNNKIANTPIHNLSKPGPTYCLKVFVSISADLPPWEVRGLLVDAALAATGVENTPAPIVRLADGERRPVRYVALIHCSDYGAHPAVRESFLFEAWRRLGAAGAEIAADTQQIDFRWAPKREFKAAASVKAIENVPLLAPLTNDERRLLFDSGSIDDYPERGLIVNAGEEGDSFFVILNGMVRVFQPAHDGQPEVEYARLLAGSFFGEMSLLTGERRSASVAAHTRTRVLEIPKSAMVQVLSVRPALAEQLAQIMAERKLANELAAEDLHEDSFTDRLAATTREFVTRITGFLTDRASKVTSAATAMPDLPATHQRPSDT